MREKPLILIVDDEKPLSDILATKLNASGMDTLVAASGEEGIKKAGEEAPDLILMDIKMPGVGGADAALALREDTKTENIKIAFLTNQSDPFPGLSGAGNNQDAARELGIDDFLMKTDDLDVNVQKIREILARPPRPPQKPI